MRHKPRIAIIGPGRLGQTLLRALLARRERVVAVGARKRGAAVKLRAPIDDDLARVAQSADIVLITVRDDDIAAVVRQIAGGSPSLRRCAVMHCSGVLSSKELAPLRELGAGIGSFHPLQTFVLPPAPPSIFHRNLAHTVISGRIGFCLSVNIEELNLRHAIFQLPEALVNPA